MKVHNILKKYKNGFSLIEVLVSIVILSFVILGSIFSYAIVHKQIRRQLAQRILLIRIQGWVEQARSSIIGEIIQLTENEVNNATELERIVGDAQIKMYDLIGDVINTDPKKTGTVDNIFNDADVMDEIDIELSEDGRFINIFIKITYDSIPVSLFTQIDPTESWRIYHNIPLTVQIN